MPLFSRVVSRFSPEILRAIRCRLFLDMPRLQRFLPPAGRVLEIGCGYGHVVSLMAECRPDLGFLGIDPDRHAIHGAQRMWSRPNLEFSSDMAAADRGRFAAVLVLDVLHHLPKGGERDVLAMAVRCTVPGGTLVVEDLWAGHDGLGVFLDTWVSRCPPLVRSEPEIVAAMVGCDASVRSRERYRTFGIGRLLLVATPGPERP